MEREQTLSLWIRVRYHPRVGGTSFNFNWLDKDGQCTQPVPTKPLSDTSPGEWVVESQTGPEDDPDEISALWEREFPCICTEEWAQSVRTSAVEVELTGAEVQAGLKLPLAPLLMCHEESRGENREGAPRPSERVLANSGVTASVATGSLPGLMLWEAGVDAQGPLLTDELSEKLRPLMISFIGARNLPMHETRPAPDLTVLPVFACGYCDEAVDADDRLRAQHEHEREGGDAIPPEDRFASVTALVGSLRTHEVAHGNEVRWDSRHVIFLEGDQHVAARWMQHGVFCVELHDRDPKESAEGVVVPHGIGRFNFAQLLAPNVRNVRMRADVVPVRGNIKIRFKKEKKGGIDVARLLKDVSYTEETLGKFTTSDERREFTADYVMAGTFLQLDVAVLCPFRRARDLQKEAEEQVLEEWAGSEQKLELEIERPDECATPFEVYANPSGDAFRARFEEQAAPWRSTVEKATDDATRLSKGEEPVEEPGLPPVLSLRYERYGRLVLVLAYKETSLVQRVLEVVNRVNERAFGLKGGTRELQVRQLSDAEKQDHTLDILTGFVVLDRAARLVVVEGLRSKALAELVDSLPRPKANDERIKFLYNRNIGFPSRAYLDFPQPMQLKQVKLRQRIEVLGQQSKVYDPAKPALIEGSARAVLALLKIKNTQALHRLTTSDFPLPAWLLSLENQYGDFITDSELVGGVAEDMKSSTVVTMHEEEAGQATGETQGVWVGREHVRKKRKADTDDDNEEWYKKLLDRSKSMPDFVNRNMEEIEQLARIPGRKASKTHYATDLSFLGEETFMYSGQKLNSVTLQKKAMREKFLADDAHLWTYSKVYNTNTFPLVEEGHQALVLRDEYVQHWNVSAPSGSGPKTGDVCQTAVPEGARGRNGKLPWQYPRAAPKRDREAVHQPEDKMEVPEQYQEGWPFDADTVKIRHSEHEWDENSWFMWPGTERGLPLEASEVKDSHLTGDPAHDDKEPWPRPFDPNMIFVGKTCTGVHVPNEPFFDTRERAGKQQKPVIKRVKIPRLVVTVMAGVPTEGKGHVLGTYAPVSTYAGQPVYERTDGKTYLLRHPKGGWTVTWPDHMKKILSTPVDSGGSRPESPGYGRNGYVRTESKEECPAKEGKWGEFLVREAAMEPFHEPLFESQTFIPNAEEVETMFHLTRVQQKRVAKGLLGSAHIKTHAVQPHCVTSTDRHDQILKPVRHVETSEAKGVRPGGGGTVSSLGGGRVSYDEIPKILSLRPEESRSTAKGLSRAKSLQKFPSSIHHQERYHPGAPNVVFQARCSQNDDDPTYNVRHGTFMPRSFEFGSKRGYITGPEHVGPAPWRTRGLTFTKQRTLRGSGSSATYVCDRDFERYRSPPTSVDREDYLVKNAKRTPLTPLDRSVKSSTLKFRLEV